MAILNDLLVNGISRFIGPITADEIRALGANYYGVCDTAAATAAKVVTCAGFVLKTGVRISVKFTNGSTSSSTMTLDVSGTGVKTCGVYLYNNAWQALANRCDKNAILEFMYNGTYWIVLTPYTLRNFGTCDARLTSADRSFANFGLEYFLATSSMTTGKPPVDAAILGMNWDNGNIWGHQLAVGNGTGRVFTRAQNGSTTWSSWLEVPRLSGALTNNQIVVSDESTGTALLKGGPTIGTGTEKFLREDGTWQVPSGGSGTVTGSGMAGYLAQWGGTSGQTSTELTVGPVFTTGTTKFLREDGTWAVPSGSGSSIWTESTTHGAVYPADAVLTGNTFADGSLTIIGQDLKDTTGMSTGVGSINMAAYGTLSCSAQSGVTSYTIASGLNAIGASSNSYDYIKSLYFFTKNGKKALKPTSVTLSGSSTVLTFSESLNPTAAITYLGYYNNCSGGNSLVTAVGATNSANCNVVVGSRIVNSGYYSTVGGLRNSNSGNGCAVFGRNSINTGAYSFLAGSNNTNTKSEACLIGKGHDSSLGSDSVTAVGQYSAIASTTAFAVGNGADMANRSNAFEVHTDGRATVGAAPTADMDVATKKYVDDNSGGGGTVDSARSTSSTNALQNSVITNFTQTLPLPVYSTAGATPTSAITCAVNSNSMVGDKIMTQDGWIGTISSITYMAGIYSASANITGTNWMAPRRVTVGTSQYNITRKALEIVDGNTTTTYYIADIT